MDRINSANTVDIGDGKRGFRDLNVVAGLAGTDVSAAWLNSIQEEMAKVIEDAGIDLDVNDWTQLQQAIDWHIGKGLSSKSLYYRSVYGFADNPPVGAVNGQTWIVGTAPTGAFVGHEHEIVEWYGDGWVFITPSQWMHCGFADKSERRWDQAAGQWVEWKAKTDLAGPIKLASDYADENNSTDAVTPADLKQFDDGIITPVKLKRPVIYVPGIAHSDISSANVKFPGVILTVTGTRFIDAIGTLAYRNEATLSCDCQAFIRLSTEPGYYEYVGVRVEPGTQHAITVERSFENLDPNVTYQVDFIMHKSEAIGPIAVHDMKLKLFHE